MQHLGPFLLLFLLSFPVSSFILNLCTVLARHQNLLLYLSVHSLLMNASLDQIIGIDEECLIYAVRQVIYKFMCELLWP